MFAWLREGKAVKSWPPRSVSRCRPAHLFGKRRRRPPNARNSLRPHCPTDPGAHELAAPPPLHKIFKFVSSSAPDSNIPFLTTLFPAWSGFSFLPELSKIQTRCRSPDSKGLDCSPLPIAQSRNVCARHTAHRRGLASAALDFAPHSHQNAGMPLPLFPGHVANLAHISSSCHFPEHPASFLQTPLRRVSSSSLSLCCTARKHAAAAEYVLLHRA